MAKDKKTEAKAEVKAEVTKEPFPTKPAPAFKYEGREEKFAKVGKAQFALSTTTLLAGPNLPKSNTSVMGKIRQLVADQGAEGITGDNLVNLMRTSVDFRQNRTEYGDGIPCVSWCQDYIVGAASKRKGYVRVKEGTFMKPERAKVTKTEAPKVDARDVHKAPEVDPKEAAAA